MGDQQQDKVVFVEPNSQAHKKGVERGWIARKITYCYRYTTYRREYHPNWLKQARDMAPNCTITFEVPQVNKTR